ncbi:DUF418 domain-containing protein [Pontibacillus litoralis]|uniref:DUF418 domain-containing protein n=1 Tax=Pontibacillus litoralis JSM 072002 TaxID=1385512 RepID=A0A0A5G3U0_9BACI|nr:DUF418 domain-containing protein [Pontibacillus litoralis]KGX87791.1 hypothetical protein N784_14395 [Pontibacillus litoralis JSM 072002]
MGHHATSLQASKRLEWIDAVRGLAIFGIFMVNVPAFNAPYFMYGGEEVYWDSDVSHAIQAFIDMFFQASFYTLFSFLFGFGMYMMKERLIDKGYGWTYKKILVRRLVALLCFGLLHGLFLWHGDILFTYGVIGFWLFLFFEREAKTMVRWAFGLLTVYAIWIGGALFAAKDYLSFVNEEEIVQAIMAYQSGTLGEVLGQVRHDWLYANGNLFSWILQTFTLLPMFLLGMYFCKKRLLHDVDTHAPMLRKLWGVSFLFFVSFKIVPYFFGNPEWFQYSLQDSIGGSASAIFYILSVTLLFQKRMIHKFFKPFTYVGRLSLSNYILQSIICFFLFYSIGFGWYGDVSPLMSVVIVVLVYSLQVYGSYWWLQHFQFGPIEWLWRIITYRTKQPFRRKVLEQANE